MTTTGFQGGTSTAPTMGYWKQWHVYWTHFQREHGLPIMEPNWEDLVWKKWCSTTGKLGFKAIEQLAETKTIGYYLPGGPTWIDDPTETLGYDMADCWASCMIHSTGVCNLTREDMYSFLKWYREFM
ncbi:MAG: hypothetical protein Ct9H90mP16_02470 [Candidatus Poseidoniales archaeon]|nr:MAG: hypothetical protein Ct9H90mP16_02470 [Candidatus Poseidoniales archaeon]